MSKEKITVVGAGAMGNGIAHVFAQHGFSVALVDISQERLDVGMVTISKNLERMVTKEYITPETMQQTLANITTFSNLDKGVVGAGLVIEAATENKDIKLRIFSELDSLCAPDTILATNTSSISITEIAASTARPEMVIGMHFMNPVPLMPLVEVIKGYATSGHIAQRITAITKTLGKTPVVVRDYPGFVANRILMPMINEAIECLHHGVAGVQEIDAIMKLGMAHPMGPLQLADFIGLDVCLAILDVLYDGFKNPKYGASPLLATMVMAGKLGVKSGEGFYDYSKDRKATVVAQQFLGT